MKSKKTNTKESWFIFAITMLAIALFLSIYLFLQNPFVTNKPASSGLVPVGTPINIQLNSTGSSAQSVFFYGSVLPSSLVAQEVKITLKPKEENAVARAKVVMFDEFAKAIPLEIITASNWNKGDDGYYYCQEVLSANLILDFAKEIKMPSAEKGLSSANVYAIIFSIETLPQSANFEEIWKIN